MNSIDKIIIIGGTGRCGTSWLADWLVRHPNAFGIPGESELIAWLARFASEASLNEIDRISGLDLKKEQYLRLAGRFAFEIYTHEDAILRGPIHARRSDQEKYFVEKTPRNIYFTKEITQMMSHIGEVFIIHPYRDGRSYLESSVRAAWPGTLRYRTNNWIRIMNKMIDHRFESNVFHIRYEELIANPSSSRKITEFCKIPHHGDIQPFERLVAPSSIPQFDPNRWKLLLEEPEVKECFASMKPTLKKLGYETESL